MLDTENKFMIFNSFVVSHFLYCPLVWDMCYVFDCKKIEKAHVMCLMILIIHILTYCTQLQKVHCI